jgi:hypothetical protein
MDQTPAVASSRWSPRSPRLTLCLLVVAILLPLAAAAALPYLPRRHDAMPARPSPVSHFPPTTLTFEQKPLGPAPGFRPQITNVQIADLDRDGRMDVIVCDAQQNRVCWQRALADDRWEEIPLGAELNGPACAAPADLDGDGDLDLVVAVLGSVYPTDERAGQVVWLENRNGTFKNHVLLSDVRRVSDVQAGDLDGDGDLDIAVAVFGYHHGEILWLENAGAGRFRDHLLFTTQGPSHVPIGDFDGDGDLDIAALVSQDHEEVWAFENRGKGTFMPRRLHGFVNFDLGSAGLIAADLDKDGKLDLILSAGDNLEFNHHFPQPWHGCIWLQNNGGWTFEPRRVAWVGGVYASAVADFNNDGTNDIACALMFNDWRTAGAASLVLLENDGRHKFTPKMVADTPINLATVAAGDLNGDGVPDLVAGSLFLAHPFDRAGRVTLWLSPKGGRR